MRAVYICVLSIDQNEQRQIEEMKKFGAERISIEKQSGATTTHQPASQEALDLVRGQDIFTVEAIDRPGRSYDEVIASINHLKKKNVQLIITNLPIMTKAVGNPLLDKFTKDSTIQILAMIAEQERTESKRRQTQDIEVTKTNGVCRGHPKLYSASAKDPQRRLIYKNIAEDLKRSATIARVVKDYNVTKQTVYRTKKDSTVSHG